MATLEAIGRQRARLPLPTMLNGDTRYLLGRQPMPLVVQARAGVNALVPRGAGSERFRLCFEVVYRTENNAVDYAVSLHYCRATAAGIYSANSSGFGAREL